MAIIRNAAGAKIGDDGWDFMTSPFFMWIHDVTGWHQGLTFAGFVVLIILGYILAFFLWAEITFVLKEKVARSSGFASFLWFWPAAFFFLVLVALHIIHTILFIWVGYTALLQIRDWWHRGYR
jgi:hypothetical protein